MHTKGVVLPLHCIVWLPSSRAGTSGRLQRPCSAGCVERQTPFSSFFTVCRPQPKRLDTSSPSFLRVFLAHGLDMLLLLLLLSCAYRILHPNPCLCFSCLSFSQRTQRSFKQQRGWGKRGIDSTAEQLPNCCARTRGSGIALRPGKIRFDGFRRAVCAAAPARHHPQRGLPISAVWGRTPAAGVYMVLQPCGRNLRQNCACTAHTRAPTSTRPKNILKHCCCEARPSPLLYTPTAAISLFTLAPKTLLPVTMLCSLSAVFPIHVQLQSGRWSPNRVLPLPSKTSQHRGGGRFEMLNFAANIFFSESRSFKSRTA